MIEQKPWLSLPREIVPPLRAGVPSTADEIIATIRRAVPAYRRPLEGAFGQAMRAGVERSLTDFLDEVEGVKRDTAEEERDIYIELGRGEAREGRTIESLLAQSVGDWTAVVVDDAGPEPEAADVVHGVDDKRLLYVRNATNLGLAGNWNTALAQVDAELVTIFHADDELDPSYLDIVRDAHHRHPGAVAVHTRARIIGEDNTSRFSFPDAMKRVTGPRDRGEIVTAGDEGLAVVVRGQFIFCPALSYKRSLLPAQPFDPQWKQVLDLDLIARLVFDGQQIIGVPDRAYRYRRHAESQTALMTSSHDRFVEEFSVYREIAQRAQAAGWTRTAAVAGRARIVRAHVLYRALGQLVRGRLGAARSTAALLKGRSSD